ncbi:MAG: histidine kinase, partial [Desulfovibrio sp.]|nr:histidine kinase [Desulfovibrio sp.]
MSDTSPVLSHILLLTNNQAESALDKKIMREAGCLQIEIKTSGAEVARALARDQSLANQSLVVCHKRLLDMSGEQFCEIIRTHPRLLALPILLVLPKATEAEQLLTLSCGASSLIARPFSVEDMHQALCKLSSAKKPQALLCKSQELLAQKNFKDCLKSYHFLLKPGRHKPEDYFKVGLKCLEQKKWSSALMAFHQALTTQIIKGQAEIGLASAYTGQGESREAEYWLGLGQETFVLAGQWQQARTVYAKLVAENTNLPNPFLGQAKRQISQGEYAAAGQTLKAGLGAVPHNTLCENMDKLCALANQPLRLLGYLEEALVQSMADGSVRESSLPKELSPKLEEQKARPEANLASPKEAAKKLSPASET